MRKLLLQLDSAPLPSVFDRVVAYDGGSDDVMSYGGVTDGAVRDLVHGAIFTRGTKDLHNTAIFIGGPDMAAGERILAAAQAAFFGPFRVSVMLDPNGSNTTAVAAVIKLLQAAGGDVRGRRAVVVAGTGPVGMRAAGLLAKAGADVVFTSRKPPEDEEALVNTIRERFGGNVRAVQMKDSSRAAEVLEGAEFLINSGPAGVMLVPRDAWRGREGLGVAIDLNAVPPLGVEGVEVNDDGRRVDGVTAIGALGVGDLKTKLHHACIARLFERNDLVLDAEAIADVARELVGGTKG
jgi:methylenetetrahydrofolate/methylenetetrahydromethanopterin dehydrogenase (NADP+)